MGLDAGVRCRCFEENRLRPGPVPYDDLYIDEEGYLASRKLTKAAESLDSRRFEARYGELERAFTNWVYNSCDHEDGECCSEHVGNIAGCAQFNDLVKAIGGATAYPLLSNLLPSGNGGLYPASKAQATLDELERFMQEIATLSQWVLTDVETDEAIWASFEGDSFTWMFSQNTRVGMAGRTIFFEHPDHPRVETSHFKQVPIGSPDDGEQPMRIICLDSDAETEVFDSLGPYGEPKTKREFLVILRKAPFLHDGKYWPAEALRHLLLASLQTGNPIRWC